MLDNAPKRRILDLGCGSNKLCNKNKFLGYDFGGEVTGLDFHKKEQVDVVYDLNKGKLPFKDNTFDIVYTHHVLEHLENLVPVLLDVHRILKKGGRFLICVPHISYLDSLGDLSHKRLFSYSSLDFVIFGKHAQLEFNEKFKLIKRRIVFGRLYKAVGIEFLANKLPNVYNGFLMGLFPAREMLWELEK